MCVWQVHAGNEDEQTGKLDRPESAGARSQSVHRKCCARHRILLRFRVCADKATCQWEWVRIIRCCESATKTRAGWCKVAKTENHKVLLFVDVFRKSSAGPDMSSRLTRGCIFICSQVNANRWLFLTFKKPDYPFVALRKKPYLQITEIQRARVLEAWMGWNQQRLPFSFIPPVAETSSSRLAMACKQYAKPIRKQHLSRKVSDHTSCVSMTEKGNELIVLWVVILRVYRVTWMTEQLNRVLTNCGVLCNVLWGLSFLHHWLVEFAYR